MQGTVLICILSCCLSAIAQVAQVRAAKENYNKIELGMSMLQVNKMLGTGYRAAGNRYSFNAFWSVGEPEFQKNVICITFDANERVISKRWLSDQSLKRKTRRTTRVSDR
jgi:hypothetical protein